MSAKAKDEAFSMTWQVEFADKKLADSAGCPAYSRALEDWRRAGRPQNIKQWIEKFLATV